MAVTRDLTFDPMAITITQHAAQRYNQRRNTDPDSVRIGIQRLLANAAKRALPPLRLSQGRYSRIFRISGFTLILDSDLTTLITLWRDR